MSSEPPRRLITDHADGRGAQSEEDSMSKTTTRDESPAAPTVPRGRGANIGLWVLQVLLALTFATAGLSKVTGAPAAVDMFETIGAGQWFRYLVGVLELAGAVGVLLLPLSGLAALGLAGVMVGATVTNVFILGASPVASLGVLLVAALVAWGRRPQTRALLRRPYCG
jgi:putative oxidoreductase